MSPNNPKKYKMISEFKDYIKHKSGKLVELYRARWVVREPSPL